MYCTPDDLITRFGEDELIQLTDMQNAGQMDMDVINTAIADAESIIDGYISARYPNLNPVPNSIKRMAADIARYQLYDDIAVEHVEKRYNTAIKTLKDIANGTMIIGKAADDSKPASNNTVQMTSGGNTFSRDDKSFI
jgi:phage gp36-like protein